MSNSVFFQRLVPLLPWITSMAVIIVASNILVEIPINDWLVWGALTYPLAFLVTDLTNRQRGAGDARLVVYCGFAIGVAASLYFATPRIALASGTAFFIAQLFDVTIFDRLRQQIWWIAPLVSSVLSTVLDTFLFFSLAFLGTGEPWTGWAIGDLGVKWVVALLALGPYAMLMSRRVAQ